MDVSPDGAGRAFGPTPRQSASQMSAQRSSVPDQVRVKPETPPAPVRREIRREKRLGEEIDRVNVAEPEAEAPGTAPPAPGLEEEARLRRRFAVQLAAGGLRSR